MLARMKTAISIPDPIFEEAEVLAKQMGLSRSELYTNAVVAYVSEYREEKITEALNRIYLAESSALDPVIAQLQALSIPKEEW
jgi:metal-responsive CopG/Arc/MetJ family transcriptional regulator